MSFRAFNHRILHPAMQGLMIFGIIALCQPWNFFLHRYGVTLIIIGLVGFMITGKIPAPPRPQPEGDGHGTREGGHA
jgi:hypothetical protein